MSHIVYEFFENLNDIEYLYNYEYFLCQHLHAVLKSIGIGKVYGYNWDPFHRRRINYASINELFICSDRILLFFPLKIEFLSDNLKLIIVFSERSKYFKISCKRNMQHYTNQ